MQGYVDLNSLLKLLCIRTNLMSVELVNKRYTFHYCQEITVTYMLVLIRSGPIMVSSKNFGTYT